MSTIRAIPLDVLEQVLRDNGHAASRLQNAMTIDGAFALVDMEHPEWLTPTQKPQRYELTQLGDLRRMACLVCDHHGFIAELNVHCTLRGPEPGCSKNWLTFEHSKTADCPSGAWLNLPNALHVYQADTGKGIGDSMVGFYAVSGLAKTIGLPVVFHSRYAAWLKRANFPGVLVDDFAEQGINMSGGWEGHGGYHDATQNWPSRLAAYCYNLATGFSLPLDNPVKPQRPSIDSASRWPRPATRYAVLAPLVSQQQWAARQWPDNRWRDLTAAFIEQGYQVIGIGSGNQFDALKGILGRFNGTTWRCGSSADEIVDLMLGATVVVGNDSGIPHVGGLLGVPTIAVHAGGLPHSYLFANAPSVTSVTSCHSLSRCDASIVSLHSIPVQAVVEALFEMGVFRRSTASSEVVNAT